ncbi:MAG: HAMP domain-containing sensor histidine kinase [Bacteroidetes bacterium]|nr:HAMP domain-containing sensor histidine kinase [Bacteroidota bacterium]
MNSYKRINRELTELNVTKDKFFSIIAHDLRSPYSALLGLSQILSDPEEKLTLQETRKYSGRIHSLLSNQFELLQNLLEWARIQLGKLQCNPEKVNVYQVMDNLLNLFSGNLLRKNIDCICDIDENLHILADTYMFQSVLHNIMSNAIKFTRNGGKIVMSAAKVNKYVEIEIQDNGIGINKERLEKILQLDSIYSTKGTDGEKGTGLGLILIKEMVEKQGGNIFIDSKEGIGTRVTIRFLSA